MNLSYRGLVTQPSAGGHHAGHMTYLCLERPVEHRCLLIERELTNVCLAFGIDIALVSPVLPHVLPLGRYWIASAMCDFIVPRPG